MAERRMSMNGSTVFERGRGRRRSAWRGAVPGLLLGGVLGASMLTPVLVHGQEDDDRDAESTSPPHDHAGMFTTILVSRDQPAADVACMFCTVRVEGDVRGDVAVLFGTVSVGEGRTISGDVAMLFSSLNVEDEAKINGDLATLFTTAQISPSARVRGDRAMMASGLGIAVLLGPLLLLVGVVWLIVWGLRRALSY